MKNVKVNKRMLRIAMGCFIIAITFTMYLYQNIQKASEPEPTLGVVHFTQNIMRDTIINGQDVQLTFIPASKVPQGAIRDKEQLIGKRLVVDVNKGEYAFPNKVTERGDIKVDINDMWVIGIDVKDISNFMGVQLRTGEYYGLLYSDVSGQLEVRNMVKIISLIDNVGREIFSNGEGVPKTINVAVKSKEEMISITQTKHAGISQFEIVKTPEGWQPGIAEELDENLGFAEEETIEN